MSYKLEKPYSIEDRMNFIVEYNHKQGLRIEETETALFALAENEIMENDIPVENPDYEQEQTQKEAERIAKLHLTRGDVFRGLLRAKGATREALRNSIVNNENLSEVDKELALIDFDEALEFYRGNALLDVVGSQLGITSQQLDKFFETNNYTDLLSE